MAPVHICPISSYSLNDAIHKCKKIVQMLRSLRHDRIDYQTRIHHYIHQCRLLKQEMCKLPTKGSSILPRMVRRFMHVCVRLRVLYELQSEVDGKLYCLGDILSQCQASLVDKIHRIVVPT